MEEMLDRALLPVLGATSACLLALWLFWPSGGSAAIADVNAELRAAQPWLPTRGEEQIAIDTKSFVDAHGISDLENTAEFTPQQLPPFMYYGEMLEARNVSYDFTVAKRILIPAGSAPKQGQDRSAFVDEMGRKFLEEECKLLLETLAKDCAVMTLSTSGLDENIQLLGSIAFVARDDLGDIAKVTQSTFSPSQSALKEKTLLRPTRNRLRAERRTMYQAFADDCRKLKDKTGNCALSHISIMHSMSDDGSTRIAGQGAFLSLMSSAQN
jgi:hypothetical protein